MQQLDDLLYSRLGRAYSGVRRGAGASTHFDVTVSRLGTSQVSVLGDVATPGSYRVSKLGTIMSALYAAAGPTQNGDMRNIELRRAGQTAGTLDLYDYLLSGNASNDLRVMTGDIVFVPPRGARVRLSGAVIRPATYELKPNETLRELLRMAGGFRAEADRRRLQIDRVVPPEQRTAAGKDRVLFDVASGSLENSTEPLRPGDIVHVLEIAPHVSNRIAVTGNVWSPGAMAFTPGMTLSDALHRAGGLKPDSYLGEVLVTRLTADSRRQMLRTAVYDTIGRPVNNLSLADGDEISVFSTTDFRPVRYITVNGAVRQSGQIPFREGMTLHDAVLLAGGMQEGALLTNAEIARLPESRAAGVTAVTTIVPLDSSYLLDLGADGKYHGPPGFAAPTAKAPEVLLQPYDAVLIKRQPEWQLLQTVTVEGEVQYPGAYSLVRKTEKLSDIIARAGGLTTAAYPDGIVFVRKQNSIGRVGVDLPHVLRDPSYIDNLQLVDGDAVLIPRYTPVVTVRGAVNSQVGVAYVPGANLDYYIRSAGGESIKGDRGHAYVTQPNGKVDANHRNVFGFTSEPRPQPGSMVFVPEKDSTDKRDWMQITATFTSILGSLVAIAAIVKK